MALFTKSNENKSFRYTSSPVNSTGYYMETLALAFVILTKYNIIGTPLVGISIFYEGPSVENMTYEFPEILQLVQLQVSTGINACSIFIKTI